MPGVEREVGWITGTLISDLIHRLEEQHALEVSDEARKRLRAELRTILEPEVDRMVRDQA